MNQATKARLVALALGAAMLSACSKTGIPASTVSLGPTPTSGSVVAATRASTAAVPTQPPTVATLAPTPLGHATAAAPTAGTTPPTTSTSAPTTSTALPTEQPAPPETSVVGDIPDTQAFVSFKSGTAGYSLDVPEGWARTTNSADVRFVSKLDGVQIAISDATAAPTATTAPTKEVAALAKAGRAVQVTKVVDVQLPGGPAVFVEFASNSEPDAVTGKQVRLENNAYMFFKGGKLATVTLYAPVGADNVDQWKRMAESFRWQ